MTIHIDFETYSEIDLPSVGAFRYAEDASTEALIVSYSLGDRAPIITVDLTRPNAVAKLGPLFNAVKKGDKIVAHNSQFERLIWEKVCKRWPVKPKSEQWDCTSARAGALALPRSLDMASRTLGLPVEKDVMGKTFIKRFCMPQADGSRILPTTDPVGFGEFMKYCAQDVVVEKALDLTLPSLSTSESKLFALDYHINDYGVPVDVPLIETTIAFVAQISKTLQDRAKKITGVKTSQRDKLLQWLEGEGLDMETLQMAEVEKTIANPATPKQVREILEIRIEMSRAGVKKLTTMLACASPDGRIRGGFWFLAASTGRWSATRVQLHNLAKPDPKYPQDHVIDCLQRGYLDFFYSRPLTAISKAIRGFIKAPEGREFLIADYSAIEPKTLAWMSGETFLLDLWRAGKDVYIAIASKIFGVPYTSVTNTQRFFGKQTVLGAGYGMGVKKFMMTCAKYGVKVSEEQATKIIKNFRASVPHIVEFWKQIEYAAVRAVLTGKRCTVGTKGLAFEVEKLHNGFTTLAVTLPSRRKLHYPEPRIDNIEKWGKVRPTLIFKTLYRGMWVDEETYGGKMVENITQAVTRDILGDGMTAVDDQGLPVFLHVHDEIGAEVDENSYNIRDFESLVCKEQWWSKDIPITAEGNKVFRYSK